MTSASRDRNSYVLVAQETNTNLHLNKKINPSKFNSNNLMTSVSMASNKTSITNTNHKDNNLIIKPKAKNIIGNSTTSVYLMTNPNEKEKSSLLVNNLLSSNYTGSNRNNDSKGKSSALNSQLTNVKCRRDWKGNRILKGKKKHQITFKDFKDSNAKLVEVVKIESYKAYNAKEIDDKEQKEINSDEINSCACSIF